MKKSTDSAEDRDESKKQQASNNKKFGLRIIGIDINGPPWLLALGILAATTTILTLAFYGPARDAFVCVLTKSPESCGQPPKPNPKTLACDRNGEVLSSYSTMLGRNDRISSDNKELKDVPAIIRQDRANFHRFNKRDDDDLQDLLFDSVDERLEIRRMLEAGAVQKDLSDIILKSDVKVEVKVVVDSGRKCMFVSLAR